MNNADNAGWFISLPKSHRFSFAQFTVTIYISCTFAFDGAFVAGRHFAIFKWPRGGPTRLGDVPGGRNIQIYEVRSKNNRTLFVLLLLFNKTFMY